MSGPFKMKGYSYPGISPVKQKIKTYSTQKDAPPLTREERLAKAYKEEYISTEYQDSLKLAKYHAKRKKNPRTYYHPPMPKPD